MTNKKDIKINPNILSKINSDNYSEKENALKNVLEFLASKDIDESKINKISINQTTSLEKECFIDALKELINDDNWKNILKDLSNIINRKIPDESYPNDVKKDK